ncbi:M24 family metallopeptidase [Thermogemmatispora sp.]|uniref:M24 family metallopeptidase n=1 Tax=Thermogemmatispora sp. TaxID=1968838 RepID=UPI001D29A44F|nr:aminopeptidase P family protein [Thermogemmatispora sp.]MBX5449813.1 aminopeptidase P family protein [Thermogemmatispora sp.]
MNEESIAAVRAWLREQELDACLITQPHNRSYLSSWLEDDAEAAWLLVSREQCLLITTPLYREVAEKEAAGCQVLVPERREFVEAVVAQARQGDWRRLGFEADALSYSYYAKLSHGGEGQFTLQPLASTIVDRLRQVKSGQELERVKKAVEITDETFAHLCRWLRPGLTEREVQWEIIRTMITLGADGPAFEPIVASGPNGSMPHARASGRSIEAGELITIDMGARYQGYCADMTRTVCLGEPREARMRLLYEAVLEAMRTCERGLHAGLSGRQADSLARDVLASYGLAEYYIHSTGHGVGLEVHEEPLLSQRAPEDALLPAGAVVTVEPGVYIPGWGGLRIEDSVLVLEDRAEVLTRSPLDLIIPQ